MNILIYTKNGFGWFVCGIAKKFDVSIKKPIKIVFCYKSKKLILLVPNGCCTNGFDVEGNCGGNGCVGNIFVVCACCTGNFWVTPEFVWGICWVDENDELPNNELFKFDPDVWWPKKNQ